MICYLSKQLDIVAVIVTDERRVILIYYKVIYTFSNMTSGSNCSQSVFMSCMDTDHSTGRDTTLETRLGNHKVTLKGLLDLCLLGHHSNLCRVCFISL